MVQILNYAGTFTENNTTLWCWADEEEYSTGRVCTKVRICLTTLYQMHTFFELACFGYLSIYLASYWIQSSYCEIHWPLPSLTIANFTKVADDNIMETN